MSMTLIDDKLLNQLMVRNKRLTNQLTDVYEALDELSEGDELPEVDEIILNGPATIVKWCDETKTVTKCREGDTFDPLFGIVACTVRKLTNNRGHAVDDLEPLLRDLTEDIHSTEDIEFLHDVTALLADVFSVLLMSEDEWIDKLGSDEAEAQDEAEDAPKKVVVAVVDKSEEIKEQVSEQLPDLIRQEIRNLVDAGEL